MSEEDGRRERVREQILEAAAQAIASRGFHGMSMRELARVTGRSLGNFYNYFSSKDEVLLALNSRAFGVLMDTQHESLSCSDDPVAQLYLFIANHVGYFVQHTDVMRVLIHEAAALEPEQRREVRTTKDRYFRIARGIVARILEQQAQGGGGEVDEGEIDRATYCVFGMMNWVYAWYDPERHGPPRELAHTIHRMAICGLVAGGPQAELQGAMDSQIRQGELPSPIRRRQSDEGAAAGPAA